MLKPDEIKKAALAGVAVVGLAGGPSSAQSDGFGDGDRDNDGTPEGSVTDAGDVGIEWYSINGTTTGGDPKPELTVADDTAGIGSGNALFVQTRGSGSDLMGVFASPLVLGPNIGDRLIFKFDVRLDDSSEPLDELTGSAEFRFGIYDASEPIGTGGFGTSDGSFDREDPGAADDKGFFIRLPVGRVDDARINYEENSPALPTPDAILGGSDAEFIVRGDDFGGLTDTSSRRIVIVLERTAGTDPENVAVTVGLDEVSFGDNTVGEPISAGVGTVDYFAAHITEDQDWVLDNFQVIQDSGSVGVALPATDGFEDGDRNNDCIPEGPVNDETDTGFNWVLGKGQSAVDNFDVEANAMLGSGNALRSTVLTSTSSYAWVSTIDEVVLDEVGEFISLEMDVTMDALGFGVPEGDLRFRAGLYNNMGTPQVGDSDTSTTSTDDDVGYMMMFDLTPEAGDDDFASVRGDRDDGLINGSNRGIGLTSDNPVWALDDGTKRTLKMTLTVIERPEPEPPLARATAMDPVIQATLEVDGQVVTDDLGDPLTGVDLGDDLNGNDMIDPDEPQDSLTFTFNQVAFGTLNVTFLDYAVDNIRVETGMSSTPCIPDLDPPGGDGALGFFDLVAYLTLFAAMDPVADLDPAGGDGAFGFFDLVAYLTLFAAGCP